MHYAIEMPKAHNMEFYDTLLYGEWNTKESASEIENCFPSSFSYLKDENYGVWLNLINVLKL